MNKTEINQAKTPNNQNLEFKIMPANRIIKENKKLNNLENN